MIRLKPLPQLALTDLQPAFYDVESVSTVEMVSKLYAYLQNLVDDYNEFITEINNEIDNFEKSTDKDIACFKKCIKDLMTNYIESIDIKIDMQNKNIADNIQRQDKNISDSIEAQNNVISEAIEYMKDNLISSVTNLFNESLNNGSIRAVLHTDYNSNDESLLMYIEAQEGGE